MNWLKPRANYRSLAAFRSGGSRNGWRRQDRTRDVQHDAQNRVGQLEPGGWNRCEPASLEPSLEAEPTFFERRIQIGAALSSASRRLSIAISASAVIGVARDRVFGMHVPHVPLDAVGIAELSAGQWSGAARAEGTGGLARTTKTVQCACPCFHRSRCSHAGAVSPRASATIIGATTASCG